MKPTLKMLAVVAVGSLILFGCSGTETAATSSTVADSSVPTNPDPPQSVTTPTTTTVPEATASCDEIELSQPLGTVLTFYGQCGGSHRAPYPIYRPGHAAPSLEQSLAALLEGTTPAERALGVYAGFDSVDEAAQVEVKASTDTDGIAHVELLLDGTPWLADTGQWSSEQLNSLLDPLLATVFASDDVTGLDMTNLCFEQIGCDFILTRADWAGMLFSNTGVLLHSGCTPASAWWYPDLCTLDGVLAQPTVSGTVVNVAEDVTLNVRAGPGTEFFVQGELPPGATVSVTKEAAVARDGGIWRLIEFRPGGAGWVNEAFLDISRTPQETLVDAFVQFAHDPNNNTFADLPLADTVDLGLGPTIIKSLRAADLRQPKAWELEVDVFRAGTGPFSAFNALSWSDIYDTTIGEHPHCASPPMPPPVGYEELERVSAQPRLDLVSCPVEGGHYWLVGLLGLI